MKSDITGYTFTNGTKVTDWISSLPADDRERATKVIEDFVSERKPLNMLQVKIKMTAPAPDPAEDYEEERTIPTPTSEIKPGERPYQMDAYNSPDPIQPTVDTPEPIPYEKKDKGNKIKLPVIIAAVILLIAIFTNPSRESHVMELTKSVARATAQSIGQDTGIDTDMFGGMFGLSQPRFTDDVIESLVYDVLNSELEYHNYILWSTCTAPVGYSVETVSVGTFGLVRPLDENLTIN